MTTQIIMGSKNMPLSAQFGSWRMVVDHCKHQGSQTIFAGQKLGNVWRHLDWVLRPPEAVDRQEAWQSPEAFDLGTQTHPLPFPFFPAFIGSRGQQIPPQSPAPPPQPPPQPNTLKVFFAKKQTFLTITDCWFRMCMPTMPQGALCLEKAIFWRVFLEVLPSEWGAPHQRLRLPSIACCLHRASFGNQ